MRLIKPSFEIIEQQPGILGLYKQIELAGRTCYKSEDKITPDSAAAFVDRMIKSGHGAMLEHGTVYLRIPDGHPAKGKYAGNKYSRLNTKWEGPANAQYIVTFVTTNLRVLVENGWTDDLKYICEPTEYHEKRVTVRFICDRGVSHEFVRHRVFSFAQESTRYCNYSKDKFGNEITFITPCWLPDLKWEGSYKWHCWCGIDTYGPGEDCFDSPQDYSDRSNTDFLYNTPEGMFISSLLNNEFVYKELISQGWKPQEARAILPNSLKTELVMTGFTSDWKHFFKLRDAGSAHPQAQELAKPLHEEFIRRNYVNE